MARRVEKYLAAAGALGTAGLTVAGAAFTETRRFVIHHEHLPILEPGALHGKKEFTVLHLTDIHMIPGQSTKIDFISSLVELKPDLVVNTGDNLSDGQAVPFVLQALGGLLRLPGLFVFGSNDYFGPHLVNPIGYLRGHTAPVGKEELPWRGMRAAFIEHGWHDATHHKCEFKVGSVRIAAAGVDDPHHGWDDFDCIAGPPNADADLSLALSHAPEPRVLRRFAADGYQLALCGHTHGGQLCLPSGKAIVTNCGIDRTRAKGLSTFDRMPLHVSNGLGSSKYVPFRLWCKPSVTLLHLTEKPSQKS